jgi:hypothetical protein
VLAIDFEPHRRQAVEQPPPGADDRRRDHQPQLVDDARSEQRFVWR